MPQEKIVVVPLLEDEGEFKVVLITSRADGKWILPKGNPEPDLSHPDVAALEAWEEAGARGSVRTEPAVKMKAEIRGQALALTCFVMDVDKLEDRWPEYRERVRRVVGLREADALLADEPAMRRVLRRMTERC